MSRGFDAFTLAACGGKSKRGFFGDTPNPGKGLPPSALLCFWGYAEPSLYLDPAKDFVLCTPA
jgi:hypothetical protein